jgi:hypothetical protein
MAQGKDDKGEYYEGPIITPKGFLREHVSLRNYWYAKNYMCLLV